MEVVEIKCRVRGKWSSFWRCKCYSVIWSHSQEHLKNDIAVSLGQQDSAWILTKNILRMFSRIRTDYRTLLTPPQRAWFSAYSGLYLKKIPSSINQDIKKLTWSGAKSNKPSHLVTWIPYCDTPEDDLDKPRGQKNSCEQRRLICRLIWVFPGHTGLIVLIVFSEFSWPLFFQVSFIPLFSMASDLGLHCLQRPVCPNI